MRVQSALPPSATVTIPPSLANQNKTTNAAFFQERPAAGKNWNIESVSLSLQFAVFTDTTAVLGRVYIGGGLVIEVDMEADGFPQASWAGSAAISQQVTYFDTDSAYVTFVIVSASATGGGSGIPCRAVLLGSLDA